MKVAQSTCIQILACQLSILKINYLCRPVESGGGGGGVSAQFVNVDIYGR